MDESFVQIALQKINVPFVQGSVDVEIHLQNKNTLLLI